MVKIFVNDLIDGTEFKNFGEWRVRKQKLRGATAMQKSSPVIQRDLSFSFCFSFVSILAQLS